MQWLSSIDPNLVIGIAVALGTWLYHRVSGQRTENFTDVIRGIGKQLVDALVTSGVLNRDALNARAKSLMDSAFVRLGIPRNALTDALATATIEHAVGDALQELRELTEASDRLAELTAQVAQTPAIMAKAQADGLARVAAMKDLVEKIQ